MIQMGLNILFVGESWVSTTSHAKGYDPFFSIDYETGHIYVENALKQAGHTVDYIPNHLAPTDFPFTMEELKKYDCVILSDIGSNTLLLSPQTFKHGQRTPNRCQLIKDYVLQGGRLLMIGGYLTFSGIDGKGRWGMTPVQDVLPVQLFPYDDRMERPEGVVPEVINQEHEILDGIQGEWPFFLGYNKSALKPEAEKVMTIAGDPFIACAAYGDGKSAVFSSDCSPHWGPKEFLEWEHYNTLWANLVKWLAK